MKHTISDLYQIQSMPLSIKVRMTENRIREWINEYGTDGMYVSCSWWLEDKQKCAIAVTGGKK